MKCAGCHHELGIGDAYIEGTASEYLGQDVDPQVGDLMAEILSGSRTGAKIVYCEDCTEEGGRFRLRSYYGDDDASDEHA